MPDTQIPAALKLNNPPKLKSATLLVALTGWMDGGEVSTGTVKQIMGRREVKQIATIDPEEFYIHNFPGSMELASLFRPHVKYEGGLVQQFEMPSNVFWADESQNLVFFVGKEPNLKWQTFADCIYSLVEQVGVTRIIFMGSFGGSVPHTREPRVFASVSHEHLKQQLRAYVARFTDYEGPGSFATMLLNETKKHNVEMISFVAEIPGYLQGMNPLSIELIAKRLARMLNQPIDLTAMRETSNEWESQVTAAVAEDEELAATVKKLEEEYDNELISSEGSEGPSDDEKEPKATS